MPPFLSIFRSKCLWVYTRNACADETVLQSKGRNMSEYIKRVEAAVTVEELSKVRSDFSRAVASGALRDSEGFRAIIGRKIDEMAK